MKLTMLVRLCVAFCILVLLWGCHKVKEPSFVPDDPYAGICLPDTNLDGATLIEAVDQLLEVHKALRKQHMEACGISNKPCSFFPGLHVSVKPLSKQIEAKRVTIRLSGCTFTEAFKEVADRFNLEITYRNGCFIFEDTSYNPEVDSVGDPFKNRASGTGTP
jgi:hypothetical protein